MTRKRRLTAAAGRKAGALAARVAGIALVAGAVAAASGCGGKKHDAGSVERPLVTGVDVATVEAAPRERFAEVVGTVRARNIAVVAPQMMGRITSVPVTEGSRVEKGAILATIEDAAVRAQAAAAEGMVAETESARDEIERAVVQAEAGKTLAEKTYERFRKLFEEKVVTQQEFDEIEARRTVAVKDYEKAVDRRTQGNAKVAQAKAQADAARAMLSYGRVTAPFSGVVTEKRIEAGSMAVPGVPIVVLEDTGTYRIEASVPETHLGALRVGTRVRAVLDSPPGKEIPGTVSEVVPVVDPMSRTFTVKADISAAGLRTGMFGRLLFPTGKETVLAVPSGAIFRVGGYDALYTVTSDNVARLVMVTTGKSFGDKVEILSGIGPGARVAVAPLDRLADGARVEVRN